MKGIFAGRTYGEDNAGVHCSAPSLGYSYDRHECVTSLVAKTLPVTASIAVGAFVLWMVLGISLGTFAALRRGKWPDHFATVFSVIGISFPSFFFGPLVHFDFCYLDKYFALSAIRRNYGKSL